MKSNRKIYQVLGPASVLLLDLTLIPAAGQSPDLLERIGRGLESAKEQLIEVRRDIHRHPEPSGQEKRTAGIVAGRLRALGFEVRDSVGGHGVVAILRGGKPGRVAAFRADMDAVRSDSPDPVPFASQEPGVRHICGHDVHTTVGLGIAEGLAAVREDLPGTVVFIFQPAEENIQGARAMIDAGALRGRVLGVHPSHLERAALVVAAVRAALAPEDS